MTSSLSLYRGGRKKVERCVPLRFCKDKFMNGCYYDVEVEMRFTPVYKGKSIYSKQVMVIQ